MAKTKLIPGFRFHPTDVELLKYYLKRKVMGKKFYNDVIAEVDIYKYAPWDLPDKSCLKTGDLEWYFFCPRGKKYGSGVRMNRATEVGYWKTTGRDRAVQHNNEIAGMIKTLVFHIGKAPRGDRTDWVMYEYRLEDKELTDKGIPQDSYVICKVFQKEGPGPRNGAQYGRPFNEEDWDDEEVEIPFAALSAPVPILHTTSHSSVPNDKHPPASGCIGSTSMSCLSGSMPSPGPVPNDKHLPASGCIGSTSMSCLSGSMPSPGPVPNDKHLPAGGCIGSSSMSCLSGSMPSPCPVPNDKHLPASGCIGSTSMSCLSGSMPSPGPVPNDKHLPASGCIGSSSMSCLSGSMPSPGPANLSDPSEQAVNNDDDILSMLEFFREDNSSLEENIAEGAPLSDFFEGLEDLDNWADFGAFSSSQNAEYSTNGMVTMGDVSGFGDLEFLELIDLDSPLFWQTTQPKSWSQR